MQTPDDCIFLSVPRAIGIGFLSEGRFGADAVLAGVCVVSTEIDDEPVELSCWLV